MRTLRAAIFGALLCLGLMAAELWQSLHSAGAAGIHLDTQGPFAKILATVGPALGWILFKVAVVYAVGGALLGLAAFSLCWAVRPRWPRAFLFAGLLGLLGLLTGYRAIQHPALFDDLPWADAPLRWLMSRASPAWALAGLGLWLSIQVFLSKGRRAMAAAVSLGIALLGGLLVSPFSPIHLLGGRAEQPLVLLVGIDALRPDRLSAYGGRGEIAPNVDRFLREATTFTRGYTPIAQTEPGWRSLLTARWPQRTGVRFPLTAEGDRLPLPTFAAGFAQAGFQTHFSTDCSRFNHQGVDSGFTSRQQPPGGLLNFALEKARFRGVALFAQNALGAAWLPELVLNRALAGLYDPMLYIERVGDQLVTLTRTGPTLLAVHLTAAHFPGDPSFPFYRRALGGEVPLALRTRMHFAPVTSRQPSEGVRFGTRAQAEGLYDELISQADAQLGALVDRLKRLGLYDRATVILFSDHGESFHADIPALAGATSVHGARISEEENRVVLAVKLPAGELPPSAPRRVDALVRLIDLGPTLLAARGLPPLPHADGVSLLPLLRGDPLPPLWLYAETGFTHAAPEVFDPNHLSGGAPRGQDLYRIHPNGAMDVDPKYRQAILDEKDRAAFDGSSWLVRAPAQDGSVTERCTGDCTALGPWLTARERDAMP